MTKKKITIVMMNGKRFAAERFKNRVYFGPRFVRDEVLYAFIEATQGSPIKEIIDGHVNAIKPPF